ncbi:MAG: hypothetical protein QF808_04395 [Thalassolituus sp.]|nr:hypothetical protein [Thalassolituus sp.]
MLSGAYLQPSLTSWKRDAINCSRRLICIVRWAAVGRVHCDLQIMKTLTESDRRFIERLGLQAQSEGFSRIAGHIWATLIVSDEPVSSSQLVDTLRGSKASVSTNTCFLERLGIVERRTMPGERQDFFSIRPHTYAALVQGQIKRLEARKEVIAEAKATITNEKNACQAG